MATKEKVEKEWAVVVHSAGRFRGPRKEAGRVKGFSEDHALYNAKQAGFENVGQVLNIAGPLYARFVREEA